jgi:hypothetical protein
MRSEATAFAREIGTTEGEATRLLFFLKDFSDRLETIKEEKRNEE